MPFITGRRGPPGCSDLGDTASARSAFPRLSIVRDPRTNEHDHPSKRPFVIYRLSASVYAYTHTVHICVDLNVRRGHQDGGLRPGSGQPRGQPHHIGTELAEAITASDHPTAMHLEGCAQTQSWAPCLLPIRSPSVYNFLETCF